MRIAKVEYIKDVKSPSADMLVKSDNSVKESSFMEIKKSSSRALGADPVLSRALNIQRTKNSYSSYPRN